MAADSERLRLLTRNRGFAALWSSAFISIIGDRVHAVALAALVYQMTGSLTETGIAFVATALPDLVIGLFAGVFVDRWDRRRVLIACDLARVPFVLLIPIVASTSLLLVYVLLFIVNGLSVIFRPAKTALIPSVVQPSELPAANSLASIGENTSDVIGYPLAGVILGVFTSWLGPEAGIMAAFAFDAATYLVSALLIQWVQPGRQALEAEAEPPLSVWSDLREGLGFVRATPVVRANTLVTLLGPLALGAVTPLLVGFAWEVLEGGDWAYAMLGTGISVGSVVGGLVLSGARRFRPGPLVLGGLGLMSLSVMATATIDSHLWLAVGIIALSGLGSMLVVIPSVTLVQWHTPDRLLGRVFSLRSTLIFAATILSNAVGGWSGETFGVQASFFGCGALLFVFTALASLSPSVRKVDALEPSQKAGDALDEAAIPS